MTRDAEEELTDSYYEEDEEQPNKKGKRDKKPFSLIGNLIFFFTIIILLAIGWAVYASWQPQDTADIPGFRQKDNAPDIPKILKQAISRDAAVTFSEEDLNRYLATYISPNQHGPVAIFATNPGIGIRLHGGKMKEDGTMGEGYMEIILERYTGVDTRHTVSLYLSVFQSIDPNNYMAVLTKFEFFNDEPLPGGIAIGGTIGSVSVPQGYMRFLLPAYENLLTTCFPILQMIEDSGMGIRFDEGQLTLSPPRKPTI